DAMASHIPGPRLWHVANPWRKRSCSHWVSSSNPALTLASRAAARCSWVAARRFGSGATVSLWVFSLLRWAFCSRLASHSAPLSGASARICSGVRSVGIWSLRCKDGRGQERAASPPLKHTHFSKSVLSSLIEQLLCHPPQLPARVLPHHAAVVAENRLHVQLR